MKKLLSGSNKERKKRIGIAVVGFALGILVTFFLSPTVLVLIEAGLIIALTVLSLSDR